MQNRPAGFGQFGAAARADGWSRYPWAGNL